MIWLVLLTWLWHHEHKLWYKSEHNCFFSSETLVTVQLLPNLSFVWSVFREEEEKSFCWSGLETLFTVIGDWLLLWKAEHQFTEGLRYNIEVPKKPVIHACLSYVVTSSCYASQRAPPASGMVHGDCCRFSSSCRGVSLWSRTAGLGFLDCTIKGILAPQRSVQPTTLYSPM